MKNEEELMEQIPEYKEYLDAHPMEWIDDFIRNRLMKGEEVPMPSEGIWLWPRIKRRFEEKFEEWLKEDFKGSKGFDKDRYEVFIQWESVPPQYDLITNKEYRDGASWVFRLVVKQKEDFVDRLQ